MPVPMISLRALRVAGRRSMQRPGRALANSALRRLGELARDRGGSAAVMFAAAAVPLVLAIGIGIDTGRGYMVKSRLSSALDAAALVGGKSFNLATRDADIQMYFNANFPAGYMGAAVTGPTIVTADVNGVQTVTLTASAVIPTTFMQLGGYENMTVASSTEVTRQVNALDVVLSIDISTSMASSAAGGGTRISAARNAATELVNILFGSDSSKQHLKIGLVPWSSKVKVWIEGQTYVPNACAPKTLPNFTNPVEAGNKIYCANNTPVPLLRPPPTDWKGCTYDRYLKDGIDNDGDIWELPATYGGKDWMGWEPIGTEGEPVSGSGKCSGAVNNQECIACPEHGVTPLQNTKQGILDAINKLTTPGGNTNIPGGLGWSWRVLTYAEPFTEAGPPDPNLPRTEAIVLLTDGENVGGSGDGYKGVWGTGSTAQPYMDARLKLLAANIKKTGVIIYVIQFANGGTALQTLLQTVASGTNAPYYHYAPDAATLTKAFREVADQLSDLRLSK